MRMFGQRAGKFIDRLPNDAAGIYHFRAGFGQASVDLARRRGLKTICDHSLVHPSLLQPLIENDGQFPADRPDPPNGFWSCVLEDIESADLVLVNSDFVAETFVFMGFDMSRVAVAYLGVEDKFMACLPVERTYGDAGDAAPLKLLFAGGIGARKGVNLIQECLSKAPDLPLKLDLAGSLSPGAAKAYAGLLADKRVTYHGMLSQQDLAELMSRSDAFVFPTLAEGSARVVFEAMAAGCAVITTPNAGSVVQDGKGGYLIAPGNVDALQEALTKACEARELIAKMGRANTALVKSKYRQANYGDKLEEIYARAKAR
ncbi:MAG: glycosyltransferase family 4 protein [Vannielia sp.]|uniref:glycosyltransferase family 4 protein n=1 Tax=Vannielia sp. TaxID=2813045 RepID=UPI003B8AA617